MLIQSQGVFMKLKLFFIVFLVVILLVACGPAATPGAPTPDVAVVRTSAASTVVSQFTLTAAVFTPVAPPVTDTPVPSATEASQGTATETSLPVAQVTNAQGTVVTLCDKYSWDPATVDVNVPDNTTMSPGQDFVKTWKVKNIGSCTWDDTYKLVFSYGDSNLKGQPQPLAAAIAPGQEVDVSVQFTAPDLPGTYTSYWTLQNGKGIAFQGNDNKVLYVKIVVQ
jgi:Ig-like domain from next to BRCA1 gene